MTTTFWELITITSSTKDAGTDNNIYFKIYFGNKSTDELLLNTMSDTFHSDVFQKGYFDNFNFQVDADLSESTFPTAIEFRHKGSNAWIGRKAFLTNRTTHEIYEISDGDFMLDGASYIKIDLQRCVKEGSGAQRCNNFNISVNTSSTKNAGTDDSVFIKLVSYDGFSHPLYLLNKPGLNDFRTGSQDIFTYSPGFELKKIAYVLFFKGSIDDWLMEHCTVSSASLTPDAYPDITVVNFSNRWLSDVAPYLNYHKFE